MVKDAKFHILGGVKMDPCLPCCDFCEHYDFNGDVNGTYIEEGFCRLLNERKDPGDQCLAYLCKYCPRKETV